MKLYLVQHGMAVDESVDPERPLSCAGRAEVERMARFMSQAGIRPDRIWHSGKLRAQQTAEIIGAAVSPQPDIELHAGLRPKDKPDKMARALRKCDEDILIAGHLPSLSRLASLLVTGKSGAEIIRFRYAGIVCLEHDAGAWAVTWVITPDIL